MRLGSVYEGHTRAMLLRLVVIVALQGRERGYRVGRRECSPGGCEGGSVVDSFADVLLRRLRCRTVIKRDEDEAMKNDDKRGKAMMDKRGNCTVVACVADGHSDVAVPARSTRGSDAFLTPAGGSKF